MIYEIINPSDQYTIEALSLDVAFVACVLLGNGQYAFKPVDDEQAIDVPLFLFGGHDEWCKKHLSEDTATAIKRVTTDEFKKLELADCLDSCLIGNQNARVDYQAGLDLIDDPVKRQLWRDRWHDSHRSSMNDIGGRAYKMAATFRGGANQPIIPAPQQVLSR